MPKSPHLPPIAVLNTIRLRRDRGLISNAEYRMQLIDTFIQCGHSYEAADHYAELEIDSTEIAGQMDYLIERVTELVKAHTNYDEAHSEIYHAIAEQFELYDANDQAPVWLSRVIAGIISDIQEASHEAQACGHDEPSAKSTFTPDDADGPSYPHTEIEGGMPQ